MDSFLISDWYLGFHLTHLDRVRTLNLLAQVADVDFYTRSDTGELSGVHCHGGVTSLDQMPIVFRRSRINLNLTMRPIETGLPQRIWDVLGAGGFLLTDERAELPSFLVPGEHVETFADEAELVEKIRYYLEHPAEREAIARAGYEEICRAGTVLHRVMEMVKIVAAEV
jgi:spore maturation protein CgeB